MNLETNAASNVKQKIRVLSIHEMALLYQKIAPSIVKIESKEFTARQLKKRMGENILQVIVDYEKVYGMTSVVDGVGIWINNGIWVVEVLP